MSKFLLKRSRQAPAEDTPAFGGVAERFRRAGDLDRAISLCREGLKKFPLLLSARVTLGWALLDQGQYKKRGSNSSKCSDERPITWRPSADWRNCTNALRVPCRRWMGMRLGTNTNTSPSTNTRTSTNTSCLRPRAHPPRLMPRCIPLRRPKRRCSASARAPGKRQQHRLRSSSRPWLRCTRFSIRSRRSKSRCLLLKLWQRRWRGRSTSRVRWTHKLL